MASSALHHEDAPSLRRMFDELSSLRDEMIALEAKYSDTIAELPKIHQESARNLIRYLAFRRRDLRPLQEALAAIGASSLGRMEPNVLAGVEAVLSILERLQGKPWRPQPKMVDVKSGLAAHTEALLGPAPDGRSVRIMVTMPGEAAQDYSLVRDLLAGGMDCMRINCAHDTPKEWQAMLDHLALAKQELSRECRVLMDIAGPKIRTGVLRAGPAVVKIRPKRDELGRVSAPARVMVLKRQAPHAECPGIDAVLPVRAKISAAIKAGDRIVFNDARGRHRDMEVVSCEGGVLIAELRRTAYIVPNTELRVHARHRIYRLRVGPIPRPERPIVLRPGDTLILSASSAPGHPARHDADGKLIAPAIISVSLPSVLNDVHVGDSVWLDDGRIGGVVRESSPKALSVEITHALPSGAKLRADKGINFPDSELQISALTEKDRQDLAFVATHADMVGYSFVRSESDVRELQEALHQLGAKDLGIVLKIETRTGFESLPALLLAVMRTRRFGVMIARGDLAVECGYERTAEVQEEILWVCEAARAPVIWATQVLESLAKTGVPSRAEVTDAAMAERAECVMLNKGPFIRDALAMLDNILRRMQAHQNKKRSMLRSLRLAQQPL